MHRRVSRGSTLGGMWTSSTPGNADDAQRRVAVIRRRQRPENEVPVSVSLNAVLGEAADCVVYLSGVHAWRGAEEPPTRRAKLVVTDRPVDLDRGRLVVCAPRIAPLLREEQ
jgi:hypothetical protein